MTSTEHGSEMSLAARILEHDGKLVPIVLPNTLDLYAIFNPSIVGYGSKLLMSFRAVNATDYCSLNRGIFPDREGPWLSLLNRDQSRYNSEHYIASLNPSLTIESLGKVKMLRIEQSNESRFQGLEDGRLVKWNGKFFLIGTRHDSKPEIGGRIECSEFEFDFSPPSFRVWEVKRTVLKRPHENQLYGHEKNWAPFADKPFEFTRWHNPLQVVRANPETGDTSVILEEEKFPNLGEFRGGSQIVPLSRGFLSIVHESHHQANYLRQRTCNYLHRFIQWDAKGRPLRASQQFSLMNMKVEFVAGLTILKENVYISFGGNDSTCFVLQIYLDGFLKLLNSMLWENLG